MRGGDVFDDGEAEAGAAGGAGAGGVDAVEAFEDPLAVLLGYADAWSVTVMSMYVPSGSATRRAATPTRVRGGE
ncbi:hypothetical protein SF12_08355 [Streptomyces sp. MBRL 601]|nr:hypothetical protein SF12_08355 [Streptomyces sp. MBRL 601]